MDRKIHLQLPNVSFEQADSLVSTSSELELDGDSETNDEDSTCQCAADNGSKTGGTGDLYDILMELPSIKKAAWARRKAAVTSAKNSSRHATNQGTRNKVTFTRPCCRKKASSSEAEKSSPHPSSSSTSHSPDSSASRQANGDNMSECESENARSRRELLFTNYPVNRRQF